MEEIVTSAIDIAKTAVSGKDKTFVALDLGPTGKLLKPYGELPFETAYELYKQQVIAGKKAGADLVLIETMGDTYEIKAAVLAAKENCDLPIVVTMIFDESGKLLTGSDIKTAVFMLEGLGVDAIGFNCGLGPRQMLSLLPELLKYSSTPLAVNPNAGLPECVNGVTFFNVTPEDFANDLKELAEMGVSLLGGCCGTTPEHLKEAVKLCKDIPVLPVKQKSITAVTSYSKTAVIGERPIIIGERINPTGKKKLKAALVSGDSGYIFSEALSQVECGADVLDVNVGLPEIDEPKVMCDTVKGIQGITNLPLQIDTSDPAAMEQALRIYNGKPMINSVNGKQEIMTSRYLTIYEQVMNYCDAVGLGIFTVLGVYTAHGEGYDGIFFLVFLGMMTGIGGGLIRDILADTMPFILYKHIYAMAAFAGALVCVLLIHIHLYLALAAGTAVVIVIRVLATHYCWDLPRPLHEKDAQRPLCTEEQQQKVAHHRGRQHHGQGEQHIQHTLDHPGQTGNIVGCKNAKKKHRCAADQSNAQAVPQRIPVHVCSFIRR